VYWLPSAFQECSEDRFQYYRLSVVLGIAVVAILFSMAYKDKIETIFRRLHSLTSKKSSKEQ